MPQIPTLNQAPKENLNVPAPAYKDVRSAGVVENAISDAAGKVAGYGMDLMEKRKKAADNDYAFKQYVDDYQAIEEYSNKLKTESGEDAKGYAEKMRSFVDKRRTDGESLATSDEGLRLYREKATSMFKGAELEAQNYENTSRAKYYVKSASDNANKLASTLLSNPDPNKALVMQRTLWNEIDDNAQTHFVDPGTREKLKRDAADGVAMSVYDGLDAMERHGEQIRLLKNTDPATDIFAGMDAEKRGALLRRAQAGIETQRRQGEAELRNEIADTMNQMMQGVDVDADYLNRLGSRVDASALKPYEKEKYADAFKVGAMVADTKKTLIKTPMYLWGNAEDIIPNRPDAKNARVVTKAQAALQREIDQMRRTAKNDPAAYAIQSSPELQSYKIKPGDPLDTQAYGNMIMARQAALGLKPAILTQAQAQSAATELLNKPATEAAQGVLALRQAHGKNAPRVFAQIAKEGKLPAAFQVAALMPTPQTTVQIIENLKKEPQYDEAFKGRWGSPEKVNERVSREFDAYNTALNTQGNSVALSNGLKKIVSLEAKRRMILGADTDIKDAVRNAMSDMVDKNFAIVKGVNKPFMIPKYDGEGRALNQETVSDFVKAYSTADGFAALNARIPKDVTVSMSTITAGKAFQSMMTGGMSNIITGSPNETDIERWHKQLEAEGYWVPSSDSADLILAININGRAHSVPDAEGKEIRRSLHQIVYDMDERTLSQSKWWFQKGIFKQNKANAGNK